MRGPLWLLAVDVTNVPTNVPQGDRTYAFLLGLAAVIAAFAAPVSTYIINRARRAEESMPALRARLKVRDRLIRALRKDLAAMTLAYHAAVWLAKSKGATDPEIPPAPVLVSDAADVGDPDGEDSG